MLKIVFITQLLTLKAVVQAQVNTISPNDLTAKPGSCFTWSENYVGTKIGPFKNDINKIESKEGDYISANHHINGIMVCTAITATSSSKVGQLNGFNGVISNGDKAEDILLNTWGKLYGSCRHFLLPKDQSVTALEFYETNGVITGLSMMTDAFD